MRDKSNRVLQYWVGSVAQLLGNDKVAICKFTSVIAQDRERSVIFTYVTRKVRIASLQNLAYDDLT